MVSSGQSNLLRFAGTQKSGLCDGVVSGSEFSLPSETTSVKPETVEHSHSPADLLAADTVSVLDRVATVAVISVWRPLMKVGSH